jgi:hypothetical protein
MYDEVEDICNNSNTFETSLSKVEGKNETIQKFLNFANEFIAIGISKKLKLWTPSNCSESIGKVVAVVLASEAFSKFTIKNPIFDTADLIYINDLDTIIKNVKMVPKCHVESISLSVHKGDKLECITIRNPSNLFIFIYKDVSGKWNILRLSDAYFQVDDNLSAYRILTNLRHSGNICNDYSVFFKQSIEIDGKSYHILVVKYKDGIQHLPIYIGDTNLNFISIPVNQDKDGIYLKNQTTYGSLGVANALALNAINTLTHIQAKDKYIQDQADKLK